MNPLLPANFFVPDVEARVMPDGRLYLYGSMDISGNTAYCSHEYHVFSTSDMVHFKHHGVSFRSEDIPWSTPVPLYAPDCIHRDGTYYLYFCLPGGEEGVATATSPAGPFKNPVAIEGASGDGIDPSVFIDEDGQAYLLWGQFSLRGAKLNPDMKTIDRSSVTHHILDEKQHGFHEGACLRKRNGVYYLVYTDSSRGRATCISYATAAHPLGPYTKGGVLVDNTGCDPQSWNNHGSIECFNNQWYLFYHRSSQNSMYNRRVCAEPIYFALDGSLPEVPMTSQGSQPPLAASGALPVHAACQMEKTYLYPTPDGREVLGYFEHNGWAVWRDLEFSNPKTLTITASTAAPLGCTLTVWAGRHLLGECTIENTGSWSAWQSFSCKLAPLEGLHPLYLVCKGANGRLVEIKSLSFF